MGSILNRLEYLTKDDFNNIKTREEYLTVVQEKVDEYEQMILEDTIEKFKIDPDELDKSYLKYYRLSVFLRRTKGSLSNLCFFIVGLFMVGIGVISPEFQKGNFRIILMIATIGIFSICGVFNSIKNLIIRRKVLKNLKEFNS